jgi:hypothetical protein
MGPPSDPRHIREWCAEEFALLLESCGFEILRIVTQRSSIGFLVENGRAFEEPTSTLSNGARIVR